MQKSEDYYYTTYEDLLSENVVVANSSAEDCKGDLISRFSAILTWAFAIAEDAGVPNSQIKSVEGIAILKGMLEVLEVNWEDDAFWKQVNH